METAVVIGVVVVLALVFELTNGWNDAANAIATVVSTEVLKPKAAVIMSASFNILGAFLSTKVATTISSMVNADMIEPSVVAAAMMSGALWNYAMTRLGLPISASHALLGSVTGAAVAAAGVSVLSWSAISKAVNGLWSSPIIGMVFAVALTYPLLHMAPKLRLPLASVLVVAVAYFYKPWLGLVALAVIVGLFLYFKLTGKHHEDEYWKKYQLISCTLMSLAHGTNDAQKVMGVITMALIAGHFLPQGAHPPVWVIFACAITMGIGTYMGGWEVIKTLGHKLTDLKPIHGFAAETATATVLAATAHLGIPVSTTHTVTGAITGVGLAKSQVNWSVAGKIGMAWIFTIPATFVMGFALSEAIVIFGLWPVLAAAFLIWLAAEFRIHFGRRERAHHRLGHAHAMIHHTAD